MPHRQRYTAVLLTLMLLLSGLLSGATSAGAVEEAYFPETGQYVREPFLSYWRANGGLAINGYPLTEARSEKLEDGKPYLVQYFERSRLEYHPENAAPYDILLGQFGRMFFPTNAKNPSSAAAAPLPDAAYFQETKHNLGGRFRAYWEANGGLAQFGFPISEEIREQLENGQTYTVQYFERARFEYHPEYAGTAAEVLLGQFGRRIVAALDYSAAGEAIPVSRAAERAYGKDLGVRVRLGTPTAAEAPVQGAYQEFERGIMVWRSDNKTILVMSYQDGKWDSYLDTWDESQPVGGGVAPVNGLLYPKRGFGKVWRDNPEVQRRLGYAIYADERATPLLIQPFTSGLMVAVSKYGSQYYTPYALYTSQRYEELTTY